MNSSAETGLLFRIPITLPALCGILSHIFLWNRGEWDGIFWAIALAVIVMHHLIILAQSWFGHGILDSNLRLLLLEAFYTASVLGSTVIYRIFFHPLRKFAGPVWAKIWVWYRVKATLASGHRHAMVLHELHGKYGDIVRVAPDQLSINLTLAIPLVHGSSSSLIKSVCYENPMETCINWERDPTLHRLRRASWESGLNHKACATYFPRILSLTNLLLFRLEELNGEPTPANRWCHFYTFDVMGELGFGQSYNQLEKCEMHPTIRIIMKYMCVGVYALMVPWLHCIISRLPAPGIEKPDWDFRAFAEEALERRKKSIPSTPDIITHVLSSTIKPRLTPNQLISDSLILQVGGSDTTTSAFVHILYHLARSHSIQSKLFVEISNIVTSRGQITWRAISRLPYLEAVINETLRLHPPAPSGMPRQVPTHEVLVVNGITIPGGTNISTPTYSLHHSPLSFTYPEDFIPERWTTESQLITDKSAFCPFGMGPYGCPGKYLAMMEMKCFVVGVVGRFEVKFPKGVDLEEVDRRIDREWKDFNTTQAAEVELVFMARGNER
ncbi:MAG: hypothetical protein M1834_001756 [Cirrosporium novae-zelandiae]|nr:MAG: hypothetical protein M1834_001756 [Cirrosporium novae-zelandiae]